MLVMGEAESREEGMYIKISLSIDEVTSWSELAYFMYLCLSQQAM